MAYTNYNSTNDEILDVSEEISFSAEELQKQLELSTDFGLDDNFDLILDNNDHFRLIDGNSTRIQRFRLAALSRENIEMNSIGVAEDIEKSFEKTYSNGKVLIERALKRLLNNFESLDSNSLEIDFSDMDSGTITLNVKDLGGNDIHSHITI